MFDKQEIEAERAAASLRAAMGAASAAGRPAWQTRVIEERYDLSERLNALQRFVALGCPAGDAISPEEMALLREQAAVMKRLVRILDKRIATFDA